MIRSVLITGGSGFFGRAFARHMLKVGCERVCIYSRGEYAQYLMRREFNDDDRLRFFIGDVRDKDRLRRAMDGVDVVIHAAALKRVEVGEYNPDELVKTNVLGAINVIEASMDARVRGVVALSTDKAAAPHNAYGTSKLMAEKLFLNANNVSGVGGTRFAVTRYGNVAGSTGSVIPTWRKLAAEGLPLKVTDPDCTRFWMTIDEAVELVHSAIFESTLLVPNLPAYRLGDLAAILQDCGDGTSVACETIGMQEGEKKHEAMISEEECNEFFMVGKYWIRLPEIAEAKLEHPLTSDRARRMRVPELKEALSNV